MVGEWGELDGGGGGGWMCIYIYIHLIYIHLFTIFYVFDLLNGFDVSLMITFQPYNASSDDDNGDESCSCALFFSGLLHWR